MLPNLADELSLKRYQAKPIEKALPDELVRARPVLSVGVAWAFLNDGQLEAGENWLRDAERWLDTTADMSERPDAPAAEMVVVDEAQFRSLSASWLAECDSCHRKGEYQPKIRPLGYFNRNLNPPFDGGVTVGVGAEEGVFRDGCGDGWQA